MLYIYYFTPFPEVNAKVIIWLKKKKKNPRQVFSVNATFNER